MHNRIREDRRLFSRINFEAEAYVSQGERRYHCQLVDISLNGVLVEAGQQVRLDKDLPCTVVIELSDEATITMHVHLIHTSTQLLGFQCTSIDMESVSHLRRLIEMNVADPEASSRVLSELLLRQRIE